MDTDADVGHRGALQSLTPEPGFSTQPGVFPVPAQNIPVDEATQILREAGGRLPAQPIDMLYEGWRQQLELVRQQQALRAQRIAEYQAALARQRPDPAERWFRVAGAIGAPTRTGSFGEALARTADVYGQGLTEERRAREAREVLGAKLGAEEASAQVADQIGIAGTQAHIDSVEAGRQMLRLDPARRFRNVAGRGLVDLTRVDERGMPAVVVPTFEAERLRAKVYESVTQRFRAREAAGERFASPEALERAIQQETDTAMERILGLALTGQLDQAGQILRNLAPGQSPVPGTAPPVLPGTRPVTPAGSSVVPTSPDQGRVPGMAGAVPEQVSNTTRLTTGWWAGSLPAPKAQPERRIETAGSEAEARAEAEAGIKRYDDIRTQAEQARTTLATLPALDSRATGVQAPVVAAFGNFLASIGVPAEQSQAVRSATDVRRFAAIVNQLNLAARIPQKGAQTDSDNAIIEATLPRINNAPALNQAIVELMRALSQRMLDRHAFIDQARDAGLPIREAEIRWNRLIEQTPMVTRLDTPSGTSLVTIYQFLDRARNPGSPLRAQVLRRLDQNERRDEALVQRRVEEEALKIWRQQINQRR